MRMLARHNKQQRSLGRHPWRDGDIIGCMVDCTEGTIGYLINGNQQLVSRNRTYFCGFVFFVLALFFGATLVVTSTYFAWQQKHFSSTHDMLLFRYCCKERVQQPFQVEGPRRDWRLHRPRGGLAVRHAQWQALERCL
jgi:hypothetical protein